MSKDNIERIRTCIFLGYCTSQNKSILGLMLENLLKPEQNFWDMSENSCYSSCPVHLLACFYFQSTQGSTSLIFLPPIFPTAIL